MAFIQPFGVDNATLIPRALRFGAHAKCIGNEEKLILLNVKGKQKVPKIMPLVARDAKKTHIDQAAKEFFGTYTSETV